MYANYTNIVGVISESSSLLPRVDNYFYMMGVPLNLDSAVVKLGEWVLTWHLSVKFYRQVPTNLGGYFRVGGCSYKTYGRFV